MWMISECAFFALSPRLYMMMPQPTEQYVQVLRVSVVRASLKLRVSASTGCGENPSNARLDPPSPAAQALKNCRRFISIGPLLRKFRQASRPQDGHAVAEPVVSSDFHDEYRRLTRVWQLLIWHSLRGETGPPPPLMYPFTYEQCNATCLIDVSPPAVGRDTASASTAIRTWVSARRSPSGGHRIGMC